MTGFNVTTRGPITAADWTDLDPVLDKFEIGIEINAAASKWVVLKERGITLL